MAITKKKPPIRTHQPKDRVCAFCKDKKLPNWQDTETLQNFLSPRGRILGREMTSVCVKHQRRLAESIKQSRHLGLLPFTTSEA